MSIDILQNPVVQGLLAKALMDFIHGLLVEVDKSGKAQENEKWLHPTAMVLALLVTAINLSLTGHLADLDLNALKDLILTYLGTKASPKLSGVSALCKKKTLQLLNLSPKG